MKVTTQQYEFVHTKRGLWLAKNGKKKTKICGPVDLPRFGRMMTSKEFFLCISFKERLGNKQNIWAPFGKLYQHGFLIRELRNFGMKFESNVNEKAFLEFIQAMEPKKSVHIAERVGWVNDNLFLRGSHLVPKKPQTVILKPDVAEDVSFIHAKGTLAKWTTDVGLKCLHSKLLIAAVSAAFAAPLCKLLDIDGGGIHIYGITSIGKTTCLYVAASVVGDPEKYVETWKTTEIAAEQTAAKYHCHLLCMDELMQIAPDKTDAGKIAASLTYLFGNGKPKRRGLNFEMAAGGRQPPFNVSILSSGEMSFDEAALKSGKPRLGGEEMRIVDIQADQGTGLGIFDSLPEGTKEPALFAKRLKKLAKKSYGTPLKIFMERLLNLPDPIVRRKAIQSHIDEFLKAARSKEHLVYHHRFAERFAVIFAGGAMAVELGVLPWDRRKILDSVMSLYETACLERRSTQGESVKKAVNSIEKKLRKAKNLIDFSDDDKLDVIETDFENHGGLRLVGSDGNVVAYKIRGRLLHQWCGSKRMMEAVIDRFDEMGLLVKRREQYRGEQDHKRHAGSIANRYRYFTFLPKVASPTKRRKKRK